jgi:hypothetical protein
VNGYFTKDTWWKINKQRCLMSLITRKIQKYILKPRWDITHPLG